MGGQALTQIKQPVEERKPPMALSKGKVDQAITFPSVGPDVQDLPALMATIRRLSVAHSLTEIMEAVTHGARILLGADGISFVLRDGDLCYYAEEDAISPLWKGKRFPMSACISGWCMIERKPAVIGNICEDARIPQDAYRPTFVQSLAMVPVRQDDPIGAIGAYWSTARAISADELDLLQSVANSAALAIAKIEMEKERARERIALFETSHRFKNLLALVDAISRQMSRSVKCPEEFSRAFSGRLQALARAQKLLTLSEPRDFDLRMLVREQVLVCDDDDRITCYGPDIFLPSAIAFDVGLVLHELGTNARKYGALSNDSGNVTVKWAVNSKDKGRALEITWTEEGGPLVTVPVSNGFGSTLIKHALGKHGGEMETCYASSGVACHAWVPLP